MINRQLLEFIRQELGKGVGRDQIKANLITNGWQENDVNEGFAALTDNSTPLPESGAPQAPATTLDSASSLYGKAWSLFKNHLWTFVGITLIPTLLVFVLTLLMASAGYMEASATGGIYMVVILVLFILALIVGQTWGQLALMYAIKDNQENIGIIEAYKRSWRKILSFWWISILTAIIIIGGFVLFVVPGVIFFVYFSLATFVLVAEDLKGMNALLKSREYARGVWGPVFWRLIFITLISIIIYFVPTIILALLRVPFAEQIVQFVMGLVIGPLSMGYLFFVYRNLKSMKGDMVFAPTKGRKAKYIIIGIIGVLIIPVLLLSTVLVSLDSAQGKARDASRTAYLNQLSAGLEIYHIYNGRYPATLDELSPEYIEKIPVDPKTSLPYKYESQDGQSYELCAQKEDETEECISFPEV
jgi:hypothetical protein